jgi:hypothetical protein
MVGDTSVGEDACYGISDNVVSDARKGNPLSQFVVGAGVLDRCSKAVDREEALRLLTLSAESGFPPAMFYLAALEGFSPRSRTGGGKPPDWLHRAVKRGHVPAHSLINENLLASACESDLQAEIRWAEGLQAKIVELETALSKARAELSQCRWQSEKRLAWHTVSRLHGEYLADLLCKSGIPYINRYGIDGAKELTVEASGAGNRKIADGEAMEQGT